jgi:hypothetical protein
MKPESINPTAASDSKGRTGCTEGHGRSLRQIGRNTLFTNDENQKQRLEEVFSASELDFIEGSICARYP